VFQSTSDLYEAKSRGSVRIRSTEVSVRHCFRMALTDGRREGTDASLGVF
jgi:hypothetical protein